MSAVTDPGLPREGAAPSGPLDEEPIARFRRDGFVVVPGFLDPALAADLQRWVDELAAWPEEPGRHWVYHEESRERPGERLLSRIENFCPHHPGLGGLLTGPRVMAAVEQLLGEPALLFKDKINFKLPGAGGFEPHQDVQAGWERYAGRHLSVLLAVDAATPENGCLELAPGRHREGLLGEPWKPLGDAVPASEYRPCPTAPGDAVFFDSFVPHRSAPNASAVARRALYATYNGVSAGDQRARYLADKHASFPPDIEREPGREYVYRV